MGDGRANRRKSEEKEGKEKCSETPKKREVEKQVQKDRLPHTGGCWGDAGAEERSPLT